MSSIRLSGSSSGYYDLTVPAAAGTNSIDLSNLAVKDSSGNLDITGDLTVDTSTLKVDSSNNRIIMGYTSGRVPTSVIVPHVNSSIAPAMRITTHGNSGYSTSNSQGAGARLEFGQYDDGYDWITGSIASTRTGSNWGGDLIFSTNNNSASNNQTEAMRINRDGQITTPYMPAFDTSRPGQQTGAHTGWTNVWVNRGNHFNQSNGRFTAPIDGVYTFYFTGIKNNQAGTTVRLYLEKNGAQLNGDRHLRLDGGGSSPYGDNGTMQWTITLSAGDYVMAATNAGNVYNSTDEYTIFGGYMIG
mgnify:CR=1 FL=1